MLPESISFIFVIQGTLRKNGIPLLAISSLMSKAVQERAVHLEAGFESYFGTSCLSLSQLCSVLSLSGFLILPPPYWPATHSMSLGHSQEKLEEQGSSVTQAPIFSLGSPLIVLWPLRGHDKNLPVNTDPYGVSLHFISRSLINVRSYSGICTWAAGVLESNRLC